jgi:hypothetical protein
MAIIVEDGTGLVDAEAYASVAFADAYHAAMGATTWADLSTSAKEIALRKATQHLDSAYLYIAEKKTTTQRLEWPRVYDPYYYAYTFSYQTAAIAWPIRCIQEACCELALKASTTALVSDETQAIKLEKIGPITVEYEQGGNPQTIYALVDNLLRQVTRGGRNTIRIERV